MLVGAVCAQPTGDEWFEVAATGSVAEVLDSLAAGADVGEYDAYGWSVAAVAAALNIDPGVVEALIQSGAAPQRPFGDAGWTLLMAAAGSTPNVEVVAALIRAGADVNARNGAGGTALHAAAAWAPHRFARRYFHDARLVEASSVHGSLITLAMPLEPGVRVVEVELYLPDLGFSFSAGVAGVESSGARIHLERPVPFPPSLEELVLLVPRLQWPEPTSDTNPLAIAQLLVEAGAAVDARDARGVTPFIQAASSGHTALAQYLLGLGADINTRTNNGETALHYATDPMMTHWLIEHGSRVDARSLEGATPLHAAVSRDDAESVRVLIEAGSDVEALRARGGSPLADAVRYGSPETIEALLDGGADPHAFEGGASAVVALAQANGRLMDPASGAVLHAVFWRLHDAQYR